MQVSGGRDLTIDEVMERMERCQKKKTGADEKLKAGRRKQGESAETEDSATSFIGLRDVYAGRWPRDAVHRSSL